MTDQTAAITTDPTRFRRAFLLLLVVSISAVFFAMMRSFLIALLLAAIFSGLGYPLYQRFMGWFRGRRSLAAATTILAFVLVVVVPLSIFAGVVTSQAIDIGERVAPWAAGQLGRADRFEEILERTPVLERIAPYSDQILAKGGELAGQVGGFVVERLASFARGTIVFFFMLFVMLYAMFFFLKDGPAVLQRILYYMPLSDEDERRMLGKFVSVTRATIKGTLLVGLAQGALAGIAFAVVGIPGAAFWGTVMAVLSILPGVGSAFVWIPGVIYLLVTGQIAGGVGLAIWCVAVVGTVDNLLRPRLVGRDTEMPDLLILLGTLGGVVLFGAVGVIIGPIAAALFITVWELYGVAFRDYLPETAPVAGASGGSLGGPEAGGDERPALSGERDSAEEEADDEPQADASRDGDEPDRE